MGNINIALIEPEIPQNTGNIARTCAAVGASLHIVKPMGFEIDNAKLKRAGLDYWHELDITYYENLASFLEINENEEKYYCKLQDIYLVYLQAFAVVTELRKTHQFM